MTFHEQLQRLKRIDQLIRLKATGTANDLAKRLDISRSSVFRLLDDLKGFGAPIIYCRNQKMFMYKESFQLIL